MKNINNVSTEIKLNGIVSKQQSNFNKLNHENFSSLLNQEKSDESEEQIIEEEISSCTTHQEVTLQNQAYLNKAFLHLVA